MISCKWSTVWTSNRSMNLFDLRLAFVPGHAETDPFFILQPLWKSLEVFSTFFPVKINVPNPYSSGSVISICWIIKEAEIYHNQILLHSILFSYGMPSLSASLFGFIFYFLSIVVIKISYEFWRHYESYDLYGIISQTIRADGWILSIQELEKNHMNQSWIMKIFMHQLIHQFVKRDGQMAQDSFDYFCSKILTC